MAYSKFFCRIRKLLPIVKNCRSRIFDIGHGFFSRRERKSTKIVKTEKILVFWGFSPKIEKQWYFSKLNKSNACCAIPIFSVWSERPWQLKKTVGAGFFILAMIFMYRAIKNQEKSWKSQNRVKFILVWELASGRSHVKIGDFVIHDCS